jgi:hypothetical protein
MLGFLVAGFTVVFLAHTAPFPFLLERFAPSRHEGLARIDHRLVGWSWGL